MSAENAVTVRPLVDGKVLRVALSAPPRNILDRNALDGLTAALEGVAEGEEHRHVRAIVLTSDGPSFSYGAAVAEHAPEPAPAMLAAFYRACRALLDTSLPVVTAVRGQCLGAGLELASLATRIVVHAEARLGQPEIRLGALAPLASIILPRRLGQGRAEDLLLSGRVVGAAEALGMGLVDAVAAGDPEADALAWVEEHLVPHSARVLRLATRAARASMRKELDALLPEVDALYRNELLATHDGAEGVQAFLEKRSPSWRDL